MDGLNDWKEGDNGLWTVAYCCAKQKKGKDFIISVIKEHLKPEKHYIENDEGLFVKKVGLMNLSKALKKIDKDENGDKDLIKPEEVAVGEDVRIIDAKMVKKCVNKRLIECEAAGRPIFAIVKHFQRKNFKVGKTVQLEHNYDNIYRML